MVGRYLKSLLRVLLFGGLVGPFFLIIYFVFETPFDRRSTGWMVLAGLLVTGADVLIALGVASNSAQRSAKRAALEQHGVLAFARITGMAETGTSINDQPVVKLALQMEILQILKASNIALDGPLDLRSNPALRHRVQDAVRRAAAAQSSPAQSSPAQPSPARRMQELNSLRAMEAISDEEYAEKRRRIISEI